MTPSHLRPSGDTTLYRDRNQCGARRSRSPCGVWERHSRDALACPGSWRRCSQDAGQRPWHPSRGAANCRLHGRTAPPGQGFLKQHDPSLGLSGPRTGRPLEAGRGAEWLLCLWTDRERRPERGRDSPPRSTHKSQGASPRQPLAGCPASETYPEFLLMKRRAGLLKDGRLAQVCSLSEWRDRATAPSSCGARQGQTEPVTCRPDLRLHLEVLVEPWNGGDYSV